MKRNPTNISLVTRGSGPATEMFFTNNHISRDMARQLLAEKAQNLFDRMRKHLFKFKAQGNIPTAYFSYIALRKLAGNYLSDGTDIQIDAHFRRLDAKFFHRFTPGVYATFQTQAERAGAVFSVELEYFPDLFGYGTDGVRATRGTNSKDWYRIDRRELISAKDAAGLLVQTVLPSKFDLQSKHTTVLPECAGFADNFGAYSVYVN